MRKNNIFFPFTSVLISNFQTGISVINIGYDFLQPNSKNVNYHHVKRFCFNFLNSCGIYAPSDARKVSPNSKERVKKNLEEGKGMSLKKMMGGSGGTSYQFASSNPMWRATLEILDFLPLANVDYSGGIITTDWYNEGTSSDESIKITVRFLTNEVRSDGIRIIVHKKRCNIQQNCTVKKYLQP